MKTHATGSSDVGRSRDTNEDAYWFDDEIGAYVVCDGMGGHAHGERAASIAVEVVSSSLRDAASAIQDVRSGGPAGHAKLAGIAEEAIEAACAAIYEEAKASPEHHGMGCTLTLLIVAGRKAVMGHVGDTRLFLLRDGSIDQLSSDHTMAADFVRKGRMTPEKARNHAYASALTRALGAQRTVEVDTLIFEVLPDDVFLLCSDGLPRYLESEGELAALLTREDLDTAPAALVELANARGGEDNVTAIVVRVSATPEEQEVQLAPGVRADLATLRSAELFADIPFAHVLRLYQSSEVIECKAGEPIVKNGKGIDGIYFVLAGSFELVSEDGQRYELDPGDHFGGPTLLVDSTCGARFAAVEAGRLLHLDPTRFLDLTALRPRVGVTLLSRIFQETLTEIEGGRCPLGLTQVRRRAAWWNPLRWARAATLVPLFAWGSAPHGH